MFKILINCVLGPPEGFEPYYGVDGYNGDGNIFRTENIKVQLAVMATRIRNLESSYVLRNPKPLFLLRMLYLIYPIGSNIIFS